MEAVASDKPINRQLFSGRYFSNTSSRETPELEDTPLSFPDASAFLAAGNLGRRIVDLATDITNDDVLDQ